jgi:hypothetical protein
MSSIKENFQAIRNSQSDVDRTFLPSQNIELNLNQSELKQLFNLAIVYWNEIFSQDEFCNKIQEYLLLDSRAVQNSIELRQYFKTVRKAGLILGSAQRFFNDNPYLPNEFVLFLRYLGRMNDLFFKPKQAKKFAEKLSSMLESDNLNLIQFNVIANLTLIDRVRTIGVKTLDLLKGSDISVYEYHEIRKEFRHVMNLFQLLAAINPNKKEYVQIFQYTCDLNSELGSVHNEYAQEKIFSPKRYKKIKVTFPPKSLKKILDLYKLLLNPREDFPTAY